MQSPEEHSRLAPLSDAGLGQTERKIHRLFILSWLFCLGLLLLVLAELMGWLALKATVLFIYVALVQWALVILAYTFYRLVRLARQIESDLARQSMVDGLTGIYNYRYLRQRMSEENDRVQRYGRHAALLFLDLDHFKQVNDRYGHEAGDEVLCALAESMRRCMRTVDVLGRVGGDEFLALLPETGGEQAQVVAGRLLKIVREFRKELPGKGNVDFVRVSIGLAVYPDNGDSMWAVLTAADNAVYKAKDKGGDSIYAAQEHITEGKGHRRSLLDRPGPPDNSSNSRGASGS